MYMYYILLINIVWLYNIIVYIKNRLVFHNHTL